MNDRYRFRFWLEEEKRFFYFGFETFLTYQKQIEKALADGLKIYQCTGLKDKNGKLIYEGDVVKIFFKFLNQKITDVVEWDNTTTRFKFVKFGQISTYNYSETWEVIGNIYENKELLDERN